MIAAFVWPLVLVAVSAQALPGIDFPPGPVTIVVDPYPPGPQGAGRKPVPDYPPNRGQSGDYPPDRPNRRPVSDYPPDRRPGGEYPPDRRPGGEYPPDRRPGGEYPPDRRPGGDYPDRQPDYPDRRPDYPERQPDYPDRRPDREPYPDRPYPKYPPNNKCKYTCVLDGCTEKRCFYDCTRPTRCEENPKMYPRGVRPQRPIAGHYAPSDGDIAADLPSKISSDKLDARVKSEESPLSTAAPVIKSNEKLPDVVREMTKEPLPLKEEMPSTPMPLPLEKLKPGLGQVKSSIEGLDPPAPIDPVPSAVVAGAEKAMEGPPAAPSVVIILEESKRMDGIPPEKVDS